jgi:hypothetical protein
MNQEKAFPPGDIPDDDARSIVIELEAHDVSPIRIKPHGER